MGHFIDAGVLAVGAFLQLYSYWIVFSFIRSMPKVSSFWGWNAILSFIALFIVGYFYALFLMFSPDAVKFPGFIVFIFFAGSIYTVISVRTGVRFSKTLLGMNSVLQESVDEKTNELRLRNQELESFIRYSPDGIIVADHDGKIVSFNNRAQSYFGFSEDEMIGKSIEILMPSAAREAHVQQRQGYVKSPGLRPMGMGKGLVAQRKDGSTFPVEISLSPVGAGDKKLVLATVRDISERKAAERQIAEQRKQLALASKLAAAGKFAGGVAHELNTPLCAIQLISEQIGKEADSGSPDLAKIRNSGQRIAGIVKKSSQVIQGLLAFARVGPPEKARPFLFKELFEEAILISREDIEREKVELRVPEVSPDLRGYGKFNQLSQAVYALIDNAWRAAKEGHEKWIQLEVSKKEGAMEIAIIDSGLGVPADIREHLFDPFFTTREIGQGPGLGLSLSFGIIEEHGGTLFLDQESPHTRFVIRFPDREKTWGPES